MRDLCADGVIGLRFDAFGVRFRARAVELSTEGFAILSHLLLIHYFIALRFVCVCIACVYIWDWFVVGYLGLTIIWRIRCKMND